MASVDQGASQRRASESPITGIGQASTLSPAGSSGESYSQSGSDYSIPDVQPASSRQRTEVSRIGGDAASDVLASVGTSYRSQEAGSYSISDRASTPSGAQEALQSKLGGGAGSILGPNAGKYASQDKGALPTFNQTVVSLFLRARDSGLPNVPPIPFVYWVSTFEAVSSYPGSTVGALVELTVLARF